MKFLTKRNIAITIFSFIPLLITLISLPFIDSTIATHFDIKGNADAWGSKYQLLALPIIALLTGVGNLVFMIYFECRQASASDEKQLEHAKNNAKVMSITIILLNVFFSVLQYVLIYNAISSKGSDMSKMNIDLLKITTILMGITLIVLANYMPKTRRNSIIGLRTPWSQKNDEVWAKSNRFASYTMIIASLLSIIAGVVFKGSIAILLLLIFITSDAIISCVYSYVISKKY